MSFDELGFARARRCLSEFVTEQAWLAADRLGFGWRPDDAAPDSYEALREAFGRSASAWSELPVATINNVPSVFCTAEANYAMRFWHDVSHVELGKDFGFKGEMVVAESHLEALAASGVSEGSVAWQLLRIDMVGQNMVFAMTSGGFVPDQLTFARSALTTGLPFAVLEAVEQIEARAVATADFERLGGLIASAS